MIEEQDDQTLLAGARRFSEEALGSIYDRYSPLVYRYALRMLGRPDLAEECVADTFTRFLQALRGGGGPNKALRAYLYRVAHNWIVDHYRRADPPAVSLDAQQLADTGDLPAERVRQAELRERLRAALFELTPDQRQVVVLKYLEAFSNDEIALSLNKSVGAVKALQHRAMKKLIRLLESKEAGT